MKEQLVKLKAEMEILSEVNVRIKGVKAEHAEQLKPDTDLKKEIEDRIIEMKDLISEDVIQRFKETGEKKYEGGVKVKEDTVYSYEEITAYEWAVEHGLCLSLNKKAFESIIKTQKMDFVEEEKVPSATFPPKIKLED